MKGFGKGLVVAMLLAAISGAPLWLGLVLIALFVGVMWREDMIQ